MVARFYEQFGFVADAPDAEGAVRWRLAIDEYVSKTTFLQPAASHTA